MLVTVLKTNIKSKEAVQKVAPLFDLHPEIIKWNVDIEDIDNVLRIESKSGLSSKKVRKLMRVYGWEVGEL